MGKTNKGAGFERTQCRDWSRWFTFGKSEDVFWRTEGSGGRAKSRAKKIMKSDPDAAESLLKYSYGDMSFQLPEGEPLIQTILFEFKRGYSAGRQLDVNKLRKIVKSIGQSSRVSTLHKNWVEKFVRQIRSLLAKTRKTPGVDVLDFVDGAEKKNDPILLQWWRNAVNECVQAKRSQVVLVLKRDGKNPTVFVDESFGRLLFKSFSMTICYGTIVCGPFNLMYFSQEDLFKHVTPDFFIKLASKKKVVRSIRRRK